jgi:thiol-disulfide isomerase/thioredoxin
MKRNDVALFEDAGLSAMEKPVPAGDFSLPLLEGGNVSLGGLKGKIVFLNFWATWCPPCRAEMPAMEALYNQFKNDDLAFIAVDLQETKDEVSAFVQEHGFTFPVALDMDGGVSAKYGVQSIPTTLIIDRDGNVITGAVGGRDWNSPEMFAFFKNLLAAE